MTKYNDPVFYLSLDWNLTDAELAEQIGKDRSTLTYWRNKLEMPKVDERRGPKLKPAPGPLAGSIRQTAQAYKVSWVTARRWHNDAGEARSAA